jgi:hypothetical protein
VHWVSTVSWSRPRLPALGDFAGGSLHWVAFRSITDTETSTQTDVSPPSHTALHIPKDISRCAVDTPAAVSRECEMLGKMATLPGLRPTQAVAVDRLSHHPNDATSWPRQWVRSTQLSLTCVGTPSCSWTAVSADKHRALLTINVGQHPTWRQSAL